MLQKLIKSGLVDVEAKVRALPRVLTPGDFFSGAGTFYLAVDAAMTAMKKILPRNVTEDLKAPYISLVLLFFFCVHSEIF